MTAPKTSSRQQQAFCIVSVGPDVCWTPRGGKMVAVPYSTIAFMDTASRLSQNVRNNGNYDFQLNSRCTEIQGHEPGVGKGVVVPGYKKYSHAEIASDFVFSDGFASVSHGDPAWINHDDPGPTEPQREMQQRSISLLPGASQGSGTSESPYGTLASLSTPTSQPDITGDSFAPSGGVQSASPYGGLPTSVPTTSFGQAGPFDLPLGSRNGGRPNTSTTKGNARARVIDYSLFDYNSPLIIRDLMKRYGLTDYQAAGFLGNFGVESNLFHADHQEGIKNFNEGGYGWAQWTDRRAIFFKYIDDHGGNHLSAIDRMSFQMNEGFLFHELDTSFSNVINQLKKAKNVHDSTIVVWSRYERPQDYIEYNKGDEDLDQTSEPRREDDANRALQDSKDAL